MKLYQATTVAVLLVSPVEGFVPFGRAPGRGRSFSPLSQELTMVDPASILAGVGELDVALEVGVALVGAAAGAATQMPRVQALKSKLVAAQEQLKATEAAMEEKIHVLEEKLFAMDEEFEEQTAKFQRQYDQTQKLRLEEIKDKLKTEMQYKLEIQLAQQKSQRLMEAVDLEHGRTSKQEELSEMRLRSNRLEEMNAQLEATLKETDEELQHLREAAQKKGKFMFW